jgi:methionyl-tRNA formyltransferase
MGGAALCEVLPLLESGRAVPVTQDPALATAAPIIERGHGRLDFQQPAHALACRVRAFTPWPGAFTTLNGKLLKVHGARALGPGELLEGAGAARAPRRSETLALGEAVGTTAGIAVGCAEGTALLLLELQLEGKKRLRAAEFLKGVALPPGTVLGT